MRFYEEANNIMNEINNVLIGKKDKVEFAMMALLAGGHLLLEDVPGVGKTSLANAMAKTMDVSFSRIQFTPDTLPSDVTGISVYNMKNATFEFQKGAIMHSIILADEINRTSPKTQSSLLEAMEERQVTVDGIIYPIEAPFMVIATQNPMEFTGTYNLPEAQLDRFLMRISIGYPTVEDEILMALNYLKEEPIKKVKTVANKELICELQNEVRSVDIHKDLITYIVNLISETRVHESLSLGASPRATLGLIRASKACAYLSGRDFVIPDDVKKVIYPVLNHRLVLSMEAKINKVALDEVIKSIIRKVRVPILTGDFYGA
ncbi:AAA family ATPase [Clostridium sp. Marseille-P299]|uniref:AAA family ATPase n=1 Tax=Clostridium sp. Marseille-P299 TaxID=1805477 RepID=UPI000830C009|nr:MoxR family ATPase [Clostridium sp. Marseille-P299]